ncbi:MAG TPA: hypothetical protein VK255_03440 [Patescibacteria group bacterium]|nr:hypothetical protein [Patescibacteria group bacterium]
MPDETTKTSNKKVIFILLVVFLLFIGATFLPFLGGLPALTNWIFTLGKKQPSLESIIESTKPTAPRDYVFQEPTKEAKNRTIDCKKINALAKLKPQNPLCLNLYKTSVEEIDKEIQTGKYDRVIVYGQNLILDVPSYWEQDKGVPGKEDPKDSTINRDDLAKRIYQSAKFNDQVVMPAMLKLYGFDSLNSVANLTGGIVPYPAIYSRATTYQDRKVLCLGEGDSEGPPIGCAKNHWANVLYSATILGDPMSMPAQRVHRNGREDFLYFDQMAPANCFADETFMHETAHNLFDLSMTIGGHALAISQLKYFNEHQAGFAKDMYPEIACGEGNVTNFRTNKDVQFASIMAYNSVYPAGEMSSAHPVNNKCELAALTEWNKILNAKNWKEKYAAFYTAMRDKTKAFSDDKGFIKFVADVSGDPKAKEFLNTYGCGL